MSIQELIRKATPEQRAVIRHQAELLESLQSPLHLGRRVLKPAEWQQPEPKHIVYLNDQVMQTIEEGGRLMVFMPPRHGKSNFLSQLVTAWYALTHPNKKIVLASYAAQYAATWGLKTQNAVAEIAPQLGIGFTRHMAMNDWSLTNGSGMFSTGVGGPLTGRGMDLGIVDDAIKNAEEAMSQRYRDRGWDWFTTVFTTRFHPGAAGIVFFTRWHEDDIAGRLLNSEHANRWRVVNLPSLAEEDDPLGRQPGEALWPERYNEAALAQIRKDIDSEFWWGSLYQQRPSPPEGVLFTRDAARFYKLSGSTIVSQELTLDPSKGTLFATMDTAIVESQASDFTVLALWCLVDNYLVLADLKRVKQDWTDHENMVRAFMAEHPKIQFVGIEDAIGAKVLIKNLKRAGLPIRAMQTHGQSKRARAQAAITMWQNGRVLLPEHLRNSEVFEEIVAFDRATHDDVVDVLGYGAIEAQKMLGGGGWGLQVCPNCQKSMIGLVCGACGHKSEAA